MSDFDDEPRADDAPGDDPWGDEEPKAARAAKPAKPAKAKPPVDDDWDDEWDDDDDRGGKRDLTLVYAVVAAAIVIVLAIVLTQGDDEGDGGQASSNGTAQETTEPTAISKNWQGAVGDAAGEAPERATSGPGIYIWTDFGGWHIRNNGSQEAVVTVTADNVRVKKTDDGDDGDEDTEAAFQTEAQVTVPAGDGSEGVGLDLGQSESATFTVTIGGQNVPVEQILLGGAEGVADQNPVTFTKA